MRARWSLETWQVLGVLALGLLVAGGLAWGPRIPQDPAYHAFADQRTCWGITHCGDVLSNLPFALIGAWGLGWLGRAGRSATLFQQAQEGWAYWVFFSGVLLTAFGSAWYHLEPDNARLVLDRLPMTLAFMGIFSAVISERISVRWGTALLGPLLLFGVASVGWWRWTEAQGRGDLRPYVLVQFYPLLAILVLLSCWPSRYPHGRDFWALLGWYGAAKLAEHWDHRLSNLTGVLSGHNLKHLLAASGTYWVLRLLQRRSAAGLEKVRYGMGTSK